MMPSLSRFVMAAAAIIWLLASTHSITARQAQPPAALPGVNQTPAGPTADQSAAPTRKPEEGIPVTSAVVQKACAACHKIDERQQMTRISFQRNTPEGWQEVIRRMAALNGLRIDP